MIAITEDDNHDLDNCEFVIRVPSTDDFLMPLLVVAPLHVGCAGPLTALEMHTARVVVALDAPLTA